MSPYYPNPSHLPLSEVKASFDALAESAAVDDPEVDQLETAITKSNSLAFRLLHPAFMAGYRTPSPKWRNTPIPLVGLDIETEATSGEPRLMGVYHPDTSRYQAIYRPTLMHLYELLRALSDPGTQHHLAVWGQLDIQELMRLFAPTEDERKALSRGVSGAIRGGHVVAPPPIIRDFGPVSLYIDHYVAQRALKVGYIRNGRSHSTWVFNVSQFYQQRIGQAARGLRLPWQEYDKGTHIIDWTLYESDAEYRRLVNASNEQDARTVAALAENIQERFYQSFKAYPRFLVSSGSLTDAACAKMLSGKEGDYESSNWRWLVKHSWSLTAKEVEEADVLLYEAYSAGMVDQYALGFFPEAHTADISDAYGSEIAKLPDLRYARLAFGEGDLDGDIRRQQAAGLIVDTAVVRGVVGIPRTLRYHPITLRESSRENLRAQGTFRATYTLEEREFCRARGATFANESYMIVALTKRQQAPIARVSALLASLRADLIGLRDSAGDADSKALFNAQQSNVKAANNSIYGKLIQTTPVITTTDGQPTVSGYMTGDKFNLLYGVMITARVRVKMSLALDAIARAGGMPILAMTDSVYWYGPREAFPESIARFVKTPGYFEMPKAIHNLYVLRAGQYEYHDGQRWHHKTMGLPIDWDSVDMDAPLYHPLIRELRKLPKWTHPNDITVTVPVTRLVSIGNPDLARLGKIEAKDTEIQPFVLGGKAPIPAVMDWPRCVDNHVWLPAVVLSLNGPDPTGQAYNGAAITRWMREEGAKRETVRRTGETRRHLTYHRRMRQAMRDYIARGEQETGKPPPPVLPNHGYWTWEQLVSHYGLPR